jgi:hypothetical protein
MLSRYDMLQYREPDIMFYWLAITCWCSLSEPLWLHTSYMHNSSMSLHRTFFLKSEKNVRNGRIHLKRLNSHFSDHYDLFRDVRETIYHLFYIPQGNILPDASNSTLPHGVQFVASGVETHILGHIVVNTLCLPRL